MARLIWQTNVLLDQDSERNYGTMYGFDFRMIKDLWPDGLDTDYEKLTER